MVAKAKRCCRNHNSRKCDAALAHKLSAAQAYACHKAVLSQGCAVTRLARYARCCHCCVRRSPSGIRPRVGCSALCSSHHERRRHCCTLSTRGMDGASGVADHAVWMSERRGRASGADDQAAWMTKRRGWPSASAAIAADGICKQQGSVTGRSHHRRLFKAAGTPTST